MITKFKLFEAYESNHLIFSYVRKSNILKSGKNI